MIMKRIFPQKSIFVLLLMALCCYSLTIEAETNDKKKKKKSHKEQVLQQEVQEDSGIEGKEDYGNTVTLVTSGTGKTKEDATNNALRSAIEQVFGTFVSSNTQILNDEMIKDEIVSISSGNVVGYEEISSVESDDGYNVSVKSVISIGKLVSYTESHGSSTELSGNTFLRNRDLATLNKENERKAVSHMIGQILPILDKGLFDFSLEVSEPYGTGEWIRVGVRVKATPNDNMTVFWDIVDQTLNSLNMEESEMKNYSNIGFPTNIVALSYDKQLDDDCDIYKIIEFPWNGVQMKRPHKCFCLRNDYSYSLDFMLQNAIVDSRFDFEIFDNLGTLISPSWSEWDKKGEFREEQKKHEWSYVQYAGGVENAFFIDFLNNKKDPYLKTTHSNDERITKIMEDMSLYLYYSANSLSQLKNISIRPAHSCQ